MGRLLRIFCCLPVGIIVFTCSVFNPPESERDLSNLEGYQIDRIQFNYFGSGRVSIKKGLNHYSGSFELSLSKDRKMRLRISHPIGGTIVTIFTNGTLLQVLNQHDREFYQESNGSDRNINNPLLMGLGVPIWQSIFWGRNQKLETGKLEFLFKQDKPDGIVIPLNKLQITVKYAKWINLKGILVPKVIKVIDEHNSSSAKFVLLEVTVPREQKLESFVPPEDFVIKNEPFLLNLEKSY